MPDRFRQGRHSEVNIWAGTDDEPDVQWAMATTPHKAAELVRLANLGTQAETHAYAANAFCALALRLWADQNPPDRSRTASIDEWAQNLPEDEAAALNAMLGRNHGNGPAWDSDHPISEWVRTHSEGGPIEAVWAVSRRAVDGGE